MSAETLVRVADRLADNTLGGAWYVRLKDKKYQQVTQMGDDRYEFEGTPGECSHRLLQQYIYYVGKRLRGYDELIQQLPRHEYRRPGFRPGWLAKQRQELLRRRQDFETSHRQRFYDLLQRLRKAGYPIGRLPQLPWHRTEWATQLERAIDSRVLPQASWPTPYSGNGQDSGDNSTGFPENIEGTRGLESQPNSPTVAHNPEEQGTRPDQETVAGGQDERLHHTGGTGGVLRDSCTGAEEVPGSDQSQLRSPDRPKETHETGRLRRTYGVVTDLRPQTKSTYRDQEVVFHRHP